MPRIRLSVRVLNPLLGGAIATALLLSTSLATGQTPSPASPNAASDWKLVEAAMGRSGQMQPGDVIKFGMPRKDPHVVLEGVEIKPGLALGSWAVFKRDGSSAMVMGDLVLTENEVEPVMMKLQEGGIHESAVHNHLIGESPRVMYMHIASHGDAVQMAKAIHDAVALTNRGDCRGGGGSCSSLRLRSAHNHDLFANPCRSVSLESARASPYRVCCRCRFALSPCVKTDTS